MRPRSCDSCGAEIHKDYRCADCWARRSAWLDEPCNYCGHGRRHHHRWSNLGQCWTPDEFRTERCSARCNGFEPTWNVPRPPVVSLEPRRGCSKVVLAFVIAAATALAVFIARSCA